MLASLIQRLRTIHWPTRDRPIRKLTPSPAMAAVTTAKMGTSGERSFSAANAPSANRIESPGRMGSSTSPVSQKITPATSSRPWASCAASRAIRDFSSVSQLKRARVMACLGGNRHARLGMRPGRVAGDGRAVELVVFDRQDAQGRPQRFSSTSTWNVPGMPTRRAPATAGCRSAVGR
jgi:hypothetical protein